ncbi:MAG TPA: glutathione S-transferase N-terminal domain-containing protein [Candidatus Binatia bacterium]
MAASPLIVWGPELSPFLLKLESMLAFHGVPWRRLPRDGSRLENLRTAGSVSRAVRRRSALRPPANDPLDEYPAVPFLVAADGDVLYDSSALAVWLDEHHPGTRAPLVPAEPAACFVACLIDEAFDEYGLYMVHHNRWKLAAADNDEPGRRLAREYSRLLPPGIETPFARWFARRQVRRLPYLFSVAPQGFAMTGVPAALTPPSRKGFPPTHELLERSWERYLCAIEEILAHRPFLLGQCFTIADASAYGQLSMNLTDSLAARRLQALAPRTARWLESIRDGRHASSEGTLAIDDALGPLLRTILETFVPLMQQNAAAVREAQERRDRLFNEKAFDAGRNLYDGQILGHRFRSVAKSFQARSWRDLCARWSALAGDEKKQVEAVASARDLDALFGSFSI